MRHSILIFLLLFTIRASGQLKLIDRSLLDKAAKKHLIVVINPQDEFVNDKTKDDDKKKISAFNAGYNQIMKEVLPKWWTFTTGDIVYKSVNDLNSLTNDEWENGMFLHSGWIKNDGRPFYSFNIDFWENHTKSTVFTFSYLADSMFSAADVIFFTKVFNNHVNLSRNYTDYKSSHNFDSCIQIVKSKTLLLDNDQTEITPAEIKDEYENKAEVVDDQRIQKEIENSSDEYLFMKLILAGSGSSVMYDVFDTKTCTMLSAIGPGGVTYQLGSGGGSGFRRNSITGSYDYVSNPYGGDGKGFVLYRTKYHIKKSHLKLADSKFAQKINFR